MPLSEMSPNMQEMDSTGRKRSHDEYAGDVLKMDEDADAKIPKVSSILPSGDSCEHPSGRSTPAVTQR